jgi:hypothetical protein
MFVGSTALPGHHHHVQGLFSEVNAGHARVVGESRLDDAGSLAAIRVGGKTTERKIAHERHRMTFMMTKGFAYVAASSNMVME